MRFDDLTGQTFGRLKVIERAPNRGNRTMWLCECRCGAQKEIDAWKLKTGNTVSCGCRRAEGLGDAMRTHGLSQTRLYRIWRHIKERCYLQTCNSYSQYGGRGITMCSEWRGDFQAFYDWAIANGYDDKLTIDRIDNDGHYEPANCRWITFSENSKKQRTDEHMKQHGYYHGMSPDGVSYVFTDAAAFGKQHGLNGSSIRDAVYRNQKCQGWSFWTDR